MKLNKEQLVDLLCTATYGCTWLECSSLKSEKHLDEKFDKEYLEERCLEEKWADRLLTGGTLRCCDYEDCDENENPKEYLLKLSDFEEKLHEAPFCDKDYIVSSFCNWRTENYDYYDCNNLMQYIMFGDVVYG